MTNPPSASIVLVTHRRPAGLRDMLGSLAAARLPPTLAEILVIENGDPNSGSREVVAATVMPVPVRWFHLPDSRLAAARNFAVVTAGGEFIILYDDDIRVGADAPAAYVAAAATFGRRHFFGGPLVARQDVAPPDWVVAFLPNSARGWTLGSERQFVNKPVFIGSNLAAFKSDILAVGGFPEYLGPGQPYRVAGEETFLQVRMLDRGMRGVFVPEAGVEHHVPVDRCGPAFALDRHFQHAVVIELARHIENRIRPSRLPQRWVWRRLIASYARVLRGRLGNADSRSRFDAELDLCDSRALFAARSIMTRHRLYDRFCDDGPAPIAGAIAATRDRGHRLSTPAQARD
ncbi:MAG: glycosyltransferase [Alphaproteobacteria bacterium]